MTIFDSIKYPIHGNMEWADVNKIPNYIWSMYLNHSERSNEPVLTCAHNQSLLRRIILEYGSDNL